MKKLGTINIILGMIILVFLKLKKYDFLFYTVLLLFIINIIFLFIKPKKIEEIKCRLMNWDYFIKNFDTLDVGEAGFVFIKLYGIDQYIQKYGETGFNDYFHYVVKFLSKTLREQDISVKINNDKVLLVLKNIPLSIFTERVKHIYYSVNNNTVFKYKFFLKGLENPQLEEIFDLDAEVEKISQVKRDNDLIIL
ncbi:hypothetical protein J7L48_08810 [bacterium]|nr:hypothetical protein [bacterium]